MNFEKELRYVSDVLLAQGVEFLVIGGFAVTFHGYPRATNDLDIWLKGTQENFLKLISALKQLGVDVKELEDIVFEPGKTFIRVPFEMMRFDFMTNIPGSFSFQEAMAKAATANLGGTVIKVISYDHLIANKEATNRPKDKLDVFELRRRRAI